jgi:hypothetical protein
MNNIQTYVPKRDRFGKFKSINFRKLAWKVIKKQLIVISLLLNLTLAYQIWNVRCEVNGQIVGYFTTKQVCGELAERKFDLLEQDRIARNLQATLTWDEPIQND